MGNVQPPLNEPNWKPLKVSKPAKTHSGRTPRVSKWRQAPIKQIGKVGKKLKVTREEWFKSNKAKANWLGQWQCYLCGNWFYKAELDLDHQLRKGSHPEARFDLDNLKPADRACHIKKDSGMKHLA